MCNQPRALCSEHFNYTRLSNRKFSSTFPIAGEEHNNNNNNSLIKEPRFPWAMENSIHVTDTRARKSFKLSSAQDPSALKRVSRVYRARIRSDTALSLSRVCSIYIYILYTRSERASAHLPVWKMERERLILSFYCCERGTTQFPLISRRFLYTSFRESLREIYTCRSN